MTAEQEARSFQLWEYKYDHSLILIRSPKLKPGQTNIDVIFYGILYIEIPQFLRRGLRFVEPTEAETARVKGILGSEFRPRWVKVFALESGNQRHLVAATAVRVVENENDIYEPILPSAYWGDFEKLGTLIYYDQAAEQKKQVQK